MEVSYPRGFKRVSSRSYHPPASHPLSVFASGRLPHRLASLQPSIPKLYQIRHMELTSPGAATLRRDPDQATGGGGTGDAETADVALAASGDGSAFERLYRTHVARVHSLARRMINPDVADDVTQDVFVRAWTTLGTERGRYYDAENALDALPGRPMVHDLSLDFQQAIGRLPDGAREVFVLHDVEGYKHEEIADMLGIVPGTSKSQLHHARMALRKHLE